MDGFEELTLLIGDIQKSLRQMEEVRRLPREREMAIEQIFIGQSAYGPPPTDAALSRGRLALQLAAAEERALGEVERDVLLLELADRIDVNRGALCAAAVKATIALGQRSREARGG